MLSVILDVDQLKTMLIGMRNKMEQQDAIINDLRNGKYKISNIEK